MDMKDFRKLTADVPDSHPFVIPTSDHGYKYATAEVGFVVHEGRNRLSEYHGPEHVRHGHTLIEAVIIT